MKYIDYDILYEIKLTCWNLHVGTCLYSFQLEHFSRIVNNESPLVKKKDDAHTSASVFRLSNHDSSGIVDDDCMIEGGTNQLIPPSPTDKSEDSSKESGDNKSPPHKDICQSVDSFIK